MEEKSIIIHDFLLSAGAILIDEEKKKVCLIKSQKSKEYLLPKGRKELDETISNAAEREVYEETGYKNKVDPEKLLGIYFRHHIGGTPGMHKIIYWYYTKLISKTKVEGTQEEHEDFSVEWFDSETALTKLTFEDDRILVQRAFGLAPNSNPNILKTIPQNDVVNCGQENKCIRYLSHVESKIIKGFLVFDESKNKILLSMDRVSKTWKLPTENDEKLAKVLAGKLSENSSAKFFQLFFGDEKKIIGWHILENLEEGAEGSKFFEKEKAIVELKNCQNEVSVIETAYNIVN